VSKIFQKGKGTSAGTMVLSSRGTSPTSIGNNNGSLREENGESASVKEGKELMIYNVSHTPR